MYKLTQTSSIIRTIDGAIIPNDRSNSDWQDYEAWVSEGNVPQQADSETNDQAFLRLQALVQKRLDDWAGERGYESILSLCSYAASTVPKFQAEGRRGVEVRDACWAYGYSLLADVESGRKPIPTEDELIAGLPAIEWPQ